MTTAHTRQLSLVVTNPQALQKGSLPRHTFGTDGGAIGSTNADWVLADRQHRVQPQHCRVTYEDGTFVVEDCCGLTYINDHREPVGKHVCVALSEGDQLHIGPYRIVANLHDGSHHLPDADRHLAQYALAELMNAPGTALDDLPGVPALAAESPVPVAGIAEFQALAATESADSTLDPVVALDAAEQQHADAQGLRNDVLDSRHYGIAAATTQADLTATRFEAVSGTPTTFYGDFSMSQHDAQATAAQSWLQGQSANGQEPAQLVSPLIQGLDAPVGPLDGAGAYRMQLEAGQALKALIQGLSALQQDADADARRLAARGRTLQPIEDNPLHLGQSYPDTVHAMFSGQRSVVQLSPAAAVEESLHQLLHQRRATLAAIEAGLDALLHAFSPEQLQQRFRRYRSSSDQPHDGDWAWQMFVNYYSELTSARQQGFHKLFWEVFDQHYDRQMRTEAQ